MRITSAVAVALSALLFAGCGKDQQQQTRRGASAEEEEEAVPARETTKRSRKLKLTPKGQQQTGAHQATEETANGMTDKESETTEQERTTSIAGVIGLTKNFLDNLLQKVQSEEETQGEYEVTRGLKEPRGMKRHGKKSQERKFEGQEEEEGPGLMGEFRIRQIVRERVESTDQ